MIDLSNPVWRRGALYLAGRQPPDGEPPFDVSPRGKDLRASKLILLMNRILRSQGLPEIDFMSARSSP